MQTVNQYSGQNRTASRRNQKRNHKYIKGKPRSALGILPVFSYTSPQSRAPNMPPGNAMRLPIPSTLRISAAANATARPYPGPSNTAQRIFTACCTGAHLLPKAGNENRLPSTATAQNRPAKATYRNWNKKQEETTSGILLSKSQSARVPTVALPTSGKRVEGHPSSQPVTQAPLLFHFVSVYNKPLYGYKSFRTHRDNFPKE